LVYKYAAKPSAPSTMAVPLSTFQSPPTSHHSEYRRYERYDDTRYGANNVSVSSLRSMPSMASTVSSSSTSLYRSPEKGWSLDTKFLDKIQRAADSTSNFADRRRAELWNVKEVCFWLRQIHLDRYITPFREHHVDGSILMLDLNESLLVHTLNVRRLHVKKVLREIKKLHQKSNVAHAVDPRDALIQSLKAEIVGLKEQNAQITEQLQLNSFVLDSFGMERKSFLQ